MKIGDIVLLKSGSPSMTIIGITYRSYMKGTNPTEEIPNNLLQCAWFSLEGKNYTAEFPADALSAAPANIYPPRYESK